MIKNGLYTQVFTLGGALAYSGTTTVNAGILQTNSAMATSSLVVNNSTPSLLGGGSAFVSNVANSLATTTAVNLASIGSTWQINNGFNQSIGSLAGVTDSRVFLQGGAGNITITITDNGGSPTVFNGVINSVSGTGVGSVVKEGTNTWVLGGGNAFGGGLTINGGIVQVAAANSVGVLGDLVPVTLADVAGVALDINGNNGSIGSLAGGGAVGGNVTLGATGTLTTGYNNTSTSFGGAVTGGTAGVTTLTKLGTGTQTLTGTNTFVGNVQIGNLGGQTGGGLTIGVGGSLADTVNVRNSGLNTSFTVNATDTVGAVTGTARTTLALGTGATLTSTYVNGTATALAATADSAAANGRIVRNINTAGLKAGDLISGTGITAGSYIVQVIDNDTVLVNQNVPTGPTNDFAPTVTSVGVLHSDITGLGGFTKDGAGLLILTGNSSHSGATTINAGDVQIGGIWTGQKFSLHDALSDNSQLVFAATGTLNLNFANSSTNLLSFERVGSLAGGSATTTINLTSGSNVGILAFGGDNSTSTFSGRFLPTNSAGYIIKEGTGNFTWSNGTTDVFDGPVFIENGTFTIAGATGFDASNEVYMTNRGSTLAVTTTGGDTIPFLQGGKGDARIILGTGSQPVGGLTSNYLTTVAPVVTLTTNLTVNENTTPVLATLAGVYTFNGDIQGAATLIKSGNHLWRLMGTSTNAFTGETQITAGTLQMGVLSRAAGVGAISGSDIFGTLSTATGLRLTGGTLDINGTTQTVTRINASSTAGTIQLVNGNLTLSNQNTQTTATVITGNLGSVLNINASAAATLSLTGNSTGFGGTINVGANAALTLNRASGALNSTGIPAARVNLNGTGTQLTVTLADTIGSLAGSGNAVLTQGLTLREAASGTSSATAFSGATSGAGALTLSGYGGLTLSGNNGHTGGTVLSSGSLLNLAYGAGNNILPGTGALTLNGGRLAVFSTAASASILESVVSLTLNAGSSSIQSAKSSTGFGQGDGLAGIGLGAITRVAGATINFGTNAASTSTANGASGVLGGYATFNGATWAVANGAGTAVNGLAAGSYTADGIGATVHNDITAGTGTGTAATLRFNGTASVAQTAAITTDTGGILVTRNVGANLSTISGALNATGNELIIHQYNPLGDLLLSNVAGTNTVITTAGGGKTLISNNITGTGTTNIGYGYLQLGDSTVGGSAAGMVGTGAILNNGTLGINRSNAQSFGTVVISGTGNIEQLGSGTTTLGGVNTFAGSVTIRGGTLEITNNSGLGLAATSPTNRWANLTSVNTGGTLLVNVTAGGTITEVLNLDGGTLDLRSTAATTLAAPIILSSDSTIHVSNPGAAVSHIISGEIYALPGADLTITNVGGGTPSTLVLAPASATGARWENTVINANGRLQIGNNSRGWLGTGTVTNNGELVLNINDGHYVLGNAISGGGNLTTTRNTVYLTADNTYAGTTTVGRQAENVAVSLRIGNDTYTGMHGTGPIIVQAVTGGASDLRYHLIADNTIANNITINANSDGTTARNATLLRQGIGNIILTGNLTIGATNLPAPGTQRSILQTEAGGILSFNGTLVGGGANNLLNMVNNGIFRLGGSVSNSYHGVLSGNNVWIFDNAGTTTLLGVNTFNTANTYVRRGTLVVGTGAVDTYHNDGDMHLLRGASLTLAGNETIGDLYTERGATVNIGSNTLTVDDNTVGSWFGGVAGTGGNVTLAVYRAIYGTNTATGTLTLGTGTTAGSIQTANLANAIGSFTTINLGAAANTGAANIEYVGPGEIFTNNLNLSGTTAAVRFTGNGTGALTINGNITNTGAGNKTLTLSGQTGGYFNTIKNTINGAITEGANTIALSMPNTGNDDRFGITGYWRLTSAANDFSGAVTVNIGMLEFGGDLGSGSGTTSVAGDLSVARTFTLGSNNFDGRRYDMFGSGDQLGDAGFSQGTNTITPNGGDVGTIIFNDSNVGTANLSNITWAMPNVSTTNTAGMQIINNGVKQVNLFNAFSFGTTGARIVVLDGSNALSNTINGAIGDPTTSQATRVDKEGPGTWRLAGTNTYTGATNVNDGILEVAGGAAIADTNAVTVGALGGDGIYSGSAKLKVVASETIGALAGNVGGLVEIDSGQTLTIANAAGATFSGVISGSGGLTRTLTGATARTQTLSNINSYGGVTTIGVGAGATASSTLAVYYLDVGGANSSIGASGSGAANLVFTSITGQGGVLNWLGFTSQSTDRLFTMGDGTAGARINAAGNVIGTNAPTITFSNTGDIAYSGTGSRRLTLGGATIAESVFRPRIQDNTGATSLTKADAGIWLLDPLAGNTYTGTTTISGGTLVIQHATALGTSAVSIAGGAGVGLQVRGGISVGNSISNTTALGGIMSSAGANTLSGTINLNAVEARISALAGSSLTLSNTISGTVAAGSPALTKFGGGNLILQGSNTFSGQTTVAGGTLTLDYGTNDTTKLSDGAALILGATAAATLLGADDNVGGQTFILGNTGGAVVLTGGTHSEVVASLTLNTGASSITRSGGSAQISLGAITRTAGATIDFQTGIAGTSTANTNGILGGYATVGQAGWAVGAALATGITALPASGYNNGLATETFGSGFNTDIINASAATGAATTNSLRFNQAGGNTLTLTGLLQLQSAGVLVTPTNGAASIITGNAIQNAATTAGLEALIILQHSASALQINSIIQNNTNAQGVTKSGTGMVYLNALNTFTGTLNVNQGTLQVGGTAASPLIATNASLGADVAVNISEGATLTFLSTSSTPQDLGIIAGGGTINIGHSGTMVNNNTQTILMNAANTGVYNLNVNSGILRIAGNNAALGDVRGITTLRGGTTLELNDGTARSFAELITYTQGNPDDASAAVTITNTGSAAVTHTLSGKQTLSNSTNAGVNFSIISPTTAGTIGITVSGIIYGSNGFTKSGNGILNLSAVNFQDVYAGFTSANKTASLLGQIAVTDGMLYVGNARALGATGVGNETVVSAGATVDLRGAATNYGDDSDANREIFKIQGTGHNGTGALRNTTGTGQAAFLTLDGNALINSGGTEDASAMVIGSFDTNLQNGNSLTGAFTRNRPVISGGGFDLTIQGGRIATDNLVFVEPTFSSALNRLIISENNVRFRHEITAALPVVGVTSADITNGITIGYAGTSLGDLNEAVVGNGANVGSRLYFENYFGLAGTATTHNTVAITMDGSAAAAAAGTPGGARSLAGGTNYLQVAFGTIPNGQTYFDGGISLSGSAIRNHFVSDSIGNYTVAEQGNLTTSAVGKMIIGGAITGAGGFTKAGSAEVRLTASNNFSGDVNVLRFGTTSSPWQSNTVRINGVDYVMQGNAEGWAEWSLTLNGANGAMTGVTNVTLQRRGMITLDNTTRLDATSGVVGGNNNDRINNSAAINLEHGWLRINGGNATNTEAFGTVNINSGTNIFDLYGTDGSGQDMDISIGTLNRTAGGILRVQNLDATSTFSTALTGGENVRLAVATLGAGAAQLGGGGAANSTNMSIVQGVLGGNIPLGLDTDLRILGFNNGNVSDLWNQQRNLQFLAGSHFMTYESGYLRPLDDDEYFTPGDGILSSSTPANQNVNLSDVITQVKNDTAINSLRFGVLQDHDGSGGAIHSGTTRTTMLDFAALNLQVDGTLTISSGMVSSAYFTAGNTSSLATLIYGGALDFNGKEAVINNQNGLYRLTDALITTGNFEIRSRITNAAGLTKTGLATVILDGANTYTGITTINDGVLFLRNGRNALGAGGTGNGVVITGNGSLNSTGGITVGTAAAREDIYIGVLQGDQQVVRTDTDVTVWNSNIIIDNVDIAGQPLFAPRIRTDNSATAIITGNIVGGDTAISNDVVAIDPRRLTFNSAANNIFILRGQFGDRMVSGNAAPIADPISMLPTLAGTRTNENEVLRVNLAGGSIETNFIFDRQYNAAGRIELEVGLMLVNYDPNAPGNDGTGFWTATAISKIPNADSVTTTFATNGGAFYKGFVLTEGAGGTANNNGSAGVLLTRPGQIFNMATWTMAGTGAKYIGGLNETGTVTFGDGTGTLTAAGAVPNLYAMDGGIVVFNQRIAGNVGTAPSSFGFLKQGRGQVTLQNTALAAASDANFVLAGGTLLLNHTGATVQALVGNLNARFDGGTLIAAASSGANTTTAFATNDAADRVLNFSVGGSEIVARTTNTGAARNMTINMGNANANGPGSNFTRGLGATANLVEDNAAGGTAQITLQFNASTTAAVKNQVIPWATYGTLSRTATDFAMADVGNSNDVRAYTRALDEYQNNVASWNANGDISENGGAGFYGSLGGPLTLSTLRFDANADSTINLGTNVLTIASTTLAQSGSAILVSSNVGNANKTITGGVGAGLTTSGGRVELILHHYGSGNLNVNVPITGAGVDLVIAGPSTTNADTIGTTGAVVLGATNTYDGQTFINGSVLSFSNANQLGTNTTAATASTAAIVMNGGTLRYTGVGLQSLGSKGILFQGGGGTIDVADGAGELYVDGDIASAAQFRGDLIKVGAGTLTLNGVTVNGTNANQPGNALFLGLIDVRQGTLRVNGDVLDAATSGTSTPSTTMFGSSVSYADGTILRSGTSLAIQMGNGNDTGEWFFDEWITFKGSNRISVGTINTQTGNTADAAGGTEIAAPVLNPNNERNVNLGGVLSFEGDATFDVVPGQTLRLGLTNVVGVGTRESGYLTGSGTIIKDGQGTMTFNTNNPDYTGAITILQGRLTAIGQADVLGTGYTVANGSKVITLGSNSRQGLAELTVTSEGIHGHILELNHNINVVYNPAQSKRVLFETFANGSSINWNGNVTLNDNLIVYINDAAETGGSQNYVNLSGQLLDGATTSGNLVLTGDDTGSANDNTSGRPYNYLVLKGNNSGWTGDVRVNTNTTYDQDQTAILRLEHVNALTASNDVDMGFNSILQAGGGARTIGALSTNGGSGPFLGGVAGGTMGASTNGTTVIIENAASTAGTLTITQTTPAATEVQWNAFFRDGTLNSQFFAPGSGPTASAALNIVKAGAGWATITTDNDYTGSTLVSGGILQVGRNGVGDTGAAGISGTRFTSNVGTTVAGTGVIQGNSTINGDLRPGDEAGSLRGTLLVNGNLTLGATAIGNFQLQRASYTAFNALEIHDALYGTWNVGHSTDPTYSHLLNDPITTAQHDKLILTGGLTITAGSKISLANNGYSPTAGDIFNLIDWTGAPTGSWNVGGLSYNGGLFRTGAETGTDLDLFQLGGGFLYDVSQFNSTGNIIVVQAETRDYYWNGDQSTNWNTNNTGNTNWLNAPAGTDPGSLPFLMDNVFFTANSAANQTTTLGQDFSINSLTFTGTGTSNTTGSSIAGNTLTLNASAGQGITVQTGSGANTISSNVVLAAAQTWTTNETTNVTTFSGVVSGGATASLTKAGPGTIVLGGGSANTYGGTTTVSAGILSVAKNDALGSTLGGTVVQADGSLELQGGITVPIGETLALNGDGATVGADGSGGALRNLSGSNSYGGSITLNSASNIQSDAGLLTIEGSISATNVNLTVEGAGNTTINGLIGTGSGTLTKNDAGTLILGNTGNSYTGSTVVNGGILQIASESNLGANPGSPSAGQLTLNGGTLATTATFTIDDANRGITIGASGGTIQTATSTVLTLSAANTVATTGTLTKSGAGALTINGSLTGGNTLQVTSGTLNGGVSGAAATVAANVTVTSSGTFSAGATGNTNGDAGNGVGRMNVTGNMIWDASSTLVFDFAKSYTDGSPTPAGSDWDLLTVSGVLTKNGGGNITLQIDSWLNDRSDYGKNEGTGSADGDDFVPSNLAGMDDPGRYRWLWVQTGGLAGFSTTNIAPGLDIVNDIVVDVSSASNVFSAYSPIPGTGGFWVSAVGNDLYINYSAVPEPGSLLLVGLAGLGFAGYRRRKRKLAEAADAAVIAASEPGENPVL